MAERNQTTTKRVSSSTMLFASDHRSDSSPKARMESFFAHIDRRAGAKYDRIRAIVNQWFRQIPSVDQHELRQRIRSGNDVAFHSSFLELYTHSLLVKMGHQVDLHPALTSTAKHPDFIAKAADSSTTIIECTVATEETTEESAVQARLNAAYDAIDQLRLPDYFLSLDIEGDPQTPIPGRQWRGRIRDWIETLNYENIATLGQQQRYEQLPKLILNHDGLTLTVEPIAKKQSARGKPGVRPIGITSPEGGWVTSRFEIRNSIRKKASRYGEPKLPYIVVVNCIGAEADQEEIEEAVYGSDGLWPSTNHPHFTRLSGVIALHHLLPWSISRADVRLFHNPHAARPYTGSLSALPQARLKNGSIELFDGVHPRHFFDLSIAWPEDEVVRHTSSQH